MNEETLIEIGLSPNEAKTYTALLEIGNSNVTQIANKTKLHRANIYESLNKLITKGLASHIKKNNTTIYEAEHPHTLLRLIKEKENKLLDVMPSLIMTKKLSETNDEASIHEGVPAFMNLLYSLLDKKEPLLIYGIPKTAPEIMKTRIPHFHKERMKRKIRMDHIYNYDAVERINFLNKMPYTNAKYLPDRFESQVSTNICGDEVIIAVWSSPVVSVRIKNKLISDSYKHHFKVLWKLAKKH